MKLWARVRGIGPEGLVYGAAALATVIAIASLLDSHGLSRLRFLQASCAKQQAANDALDAQNAALLRTIHALGEPIDRAVLERTAREQLGFIKPDEIVFKFE